MILHGQIFRNLLRDNISTLGSHELNLDDFLSKIHIPKIDKYKDHLFIILNFPVNMREEKHEYDIFVGINYLLTIHQSEVEPLVEMFQRCKSNEKERETSMGDSPGFYCIARSIGKWSIP